MTRHNLREEKSLRPNESFDMEDDDDPEIIIKLEGCEYFWKVEKSKLVKHSGFFRRMFDHEFQESRENSVLLHDDNEDALDWLLTSFDNASVFYNDLSLELMEDEILPQKGDWATEIPVGKDGIENILAVCALVLKYDCASFMAYIAEALTRSFKILQEKPATEIQYVSLVRNQVELFNSHNGGRYPDELALTLARAWFSLPAWAEECHSLVLAAIESNARVGAAVSKYYHRKLTDLAKTTEDQRDVLRDLYPDEN